MDIEDCSTCKHCKDKSIWTCEIEEPCINNICYESENKKELFNEIET
jgi:hypothetical protein